MPDNIFTNNSWMFWLHLFAKRNDGHIVRKDEQFPNAFRMFSENEDLSAASDELLRSCGIPCGQILRIKSGIDQFLGNNAKTTKVLIIKLIINHLIWD